MKRLLPLWMAVTLLGTACASSSKMAPEPAAPEPAKAAKTMERTMPEVRYYVIADT